MASFSNGKFNLTIVFEGFTPSTQEFNDWKIAFSDASQILFNATGGQMQLGKLEYYFNGSHSLLDDVFLKNYSGLSCRTGDVGVFGGWLKITNNALATPVLITHELGHYLFDLGDEYKRISFQLPTVPKCIKDASRNGGCLMEYSSTVSDQFGVSEFCNKRPPGNNQQNQYHSGLPTGQNQRHNGQACWETIATNYTITSPVGVPNHGVVPGHAPLVWQQLSTQNTFAFAIIGSPVLDDAPLDRGVKNYLNFHLHLLSEFGHKAVLVSNEPDDKTVAGPVPVNKSNLESLKTSVNGLNLGTNRDASETVASALIPLVAPETRSVVRGLILIAPGQLPDSLPQPEESDLRSNRIRFISTSLGTGTDADFVRSVTNSKLDSTLLLPDQDTGVDATLSFQSHHIGNAFELIESFGAIALRAGRLTERLEDDLTVDSFEESLFYNFEYRAESFDMPLQIEDGCKEAWIVIAQPPGVPTEARLVTPSADHLTLDESLDDDSIQWRRLVSPAAGRWMIRLQRVGGTDAIPFRILGFSRNPKLALIANATVQKQVVKISSQAVYEDPLVHLQHSASIYQSKIGNFEDTEKVAEIVLQPASYSPKVATDPLPVGGDNPVGGDHQDSAESEEPLAPASDFGMLQPSSGRFEANLALPPGTYSAVIKVSNSGSAVAASNTARLPDANPDVSQKPQIPAFERYRHIQFVINEQD